MEAMPSEGRPRRPPGLHWRPHSATIRPAVFGPAFHDNEQLQGANMKLAFFDDYKLGVVVGDKIVDVSAVTKGIKALGPQDVIRGVIENFGALKGKLAAAAKKGKGKPLSKVKLRPPLPKPENIICMAVNYMEDGTLPEPAPINAFMKSPSSIIGDGDTMVLPGHGGIVFEGEAEFAVVIGKKASHVQAKDAMKYVFGYTTSSTVRRAAWCRRPTCSTR
jgi:hypothetical protein